MPRFGQDGAPAAANPAGVWLWTGSLWLRALADSSGRLIVGNIVQLGGQAPQWDDTDKLAVSAYGKASAAGDTPVLVDSSGRIIVVGAAPQGSPGAGNPVQMGLMTVPGNMIPAVAISNGSSGHDNTLNNLVGVIADLHVYDPNNTSAEWTPAAQVNQTFTILASAARTATLQSADQTNIFGRGLIVFVNVSAITATPILTPYLEIKDAISGAYKTIWTAAATITATGQYAYLFVPGGAAGSYTEAVNLRVARDWRLGVTHADTDSATYSVGGVLLI